jgi:hypothetical protein
LLVETIRKQVARILRSLKPEDFQRRGRHSEAGALTLEAFVQRSTNHIPHHIKFITEKRAALARCQPGVAVTTIIQIRLSLSNSFLVLGERPVRFRFCSAAARPSSAIY